MKTRFPNVTIAPDRHGKLRARFRKNGASKWMKTLPDQPGFESELAALQAEGVPIEPRYAAGSVNDLCVRYYRSADHRAKGNDASRARRRGLIEQFRGEFGNDIVADFSFEHIEAILLRRLEKKLGERGKVTGGEVAAFNTRKALRRLFALAKKLGWLPTNPVEDAEAVGREKLTGFHPWSEAEIARYKQRHPVGTKPRLAMEIILWTGQRRGDARLFGPRHIVRGKINFQAAKNDADLWLPMAPDLRAAIDAMASVGITTYLVTDYGKPFSAAGFGNKMREWCDEAGLPLCTAHGLRHVLGRRLAISGATQQGMKAAGGWKGDDEVRTYAASAEQETLADMAMAGVIERFSDGKTA